MTSSLGKIRKKIKEEVASLLNIYVADLELHGVLIFATEQRPSLAEEGGPIISTGHYIHNYPLIYGFAGRNIEAYSVIPSLHFLSYEDLGKNMMIRNNKRKLQYTYVEEQLRNLLEGRESIYVFPAYPEKVIAKKFFMQAKGSGYAEFRGALKTVYPRLEHYVAIVPPSRFKTIVISRGSELPKEMYLRIGMKRMGLFKVYLRKADIGENVVEPVWSTIPVNLYDVEIFGYTPVDVAKVLETRSKAPGKLLASVIGYIRARNMFVVKTDKRFIVPLPMKAERR